MNGLENEAPLGTALGMDTAFADVMATMAPEVFGAPDGAGDQEVFTPASGAGQPTTPSEVVGGTPLAVPAAADGTPGEFSVSPEGGAPGVGVGDSAGPVPGAVDYSAIAPRFGEISVALEEGVAKIHQEAALKEVQTQHAKYFQALRQHPRTLVGQKVPAIGKPGEEVLRDSTDAKDWQDAVKQLLSDEIRDKASRMADENSSMMSVLHSSIELFQNNTDLVPGTVQFDRELADQFAMYAQPYELRVDGKLNGYTIPVQPLINQIRSKLAAARAAQAAPQPPQVAPGKTGAPTPARTPEKPARGPQAGIQSRAGTTAEKEDFSTLFGTIGLRDFQI